MHDGRAHGGRRSLLVHDEMGGNESLRPSSTTGDLPFDILYINKDIDDAATQPMT